MTRYGVLSCRKLYTCLCTYMHTYTCIFQIGKLWSEPIVFSNDASLGGSSNLGSNGVSAWIDQFKKRYSAERKDQNVHVCMCVCVCMCEGGACVCVRL
jgi:hypothetical protein